MPSKTPSGNVTTPLPSRPAVATGAASVVGMSGAVMGAALVAVVGLMMG